MKLRELFESRLPEPAEIDAAMGQELAPGEHDMTPYSAPMRGPAATPFTVYQAISAVLGHEDVTNDEDDLTEENHMQMVYVYEGSRNGYYIATDDGTGGSIEVHNMGSKAAADVAVGVHEACHALVHRKTGGEGRLSSQEKIVNNMAERWIRKHLHGMAQHVALETITGSRIDYGPNHMPRPSPSDLRELFDQSSAYDYEWDQEQGQDTARAYDQEGRLIEIVITYDHEGTAHMEFSRGGSMGNTGQGGEHAVFATVIKAIGEWIDTNPNVRTIYFVGEGASRKKLYDRLVARVAAEYGFTRAARPGNSVYKLVRDQA